MPENTSKIELRSDEVKDILGHVPNWIVRWGILLFFLCFALIIAGSWVFKYPDLLRPGIYITTENPPHHVIARADGRIAHLLVKDNSLVKANQVLGLIENPAVYPDVINLREHLDTFRIMQVDPDNNYQYNFPPNLLLGDIQSHYAYFLKVYEDLRQFIILDYHQKKINALKEEIVRYHNYSRRLRNQSNILSQEESLAVKQMKRDSALYSQGMIPEADYEKTKTLWLQKRYNLEQSYITLASNQIEISKLEQQILDIGLQNNQEMSKLELSLNEAYDNLMAQITLWEQKYVLKSSVNGIVSFTRIWSENQNVRNGDMVMSVIPEDQGEIIGKINLPVTGSGKVKTGQRVNIKFSNFPYMEYGMVKGTIRSISLVTNDNLYSVIVNLPDGLKTNYGIELDFNQDMQGIAEIITEDKRLLERVVIPVRSVITRQRGLRNR